MQHKFNPPAPQLINRIPHDPDNWLFWVTKHGVRMTGMPTWDGIMSDEEIWKVIAFIKHSNALPPETAAAWQKLAAEPTDDRGAHARAARARRAPRSLNSVSESAMTTASDRA